MSVSMGAMADESNPHDDASDLAALQGYATELADGVQAALAPWVRRSVLRVHGQWVDAGRPGRADAADDLGAEAAGLRAAADQAGAACAEEIGGAVRGVLALDIDAQRVNPLAVVRRAVTYPTAVLRAAGVPPLERDRQAEAQFPGDDYDLTPASFADLDPALHEPGLRWGAAKAHVHLRRHRPPTS